MKDLAAEERGKEQIPRRWGLESAHLLGRDPGARAAVGLKCHGSRAEA